MPDPWPHPRSIRRDGLRTYRAGGIPPDASALMERAGLGGCLSARHGLFSSPCAVTKMVGIGQRSAFNLACKSRPDMPGMRMSVIRHPVSFSWPDARNSSAEANDRTVNPADLSKRCNAARNESSSSTTATIFVFVNVSIRLEDRLICAQRNYGFP